MLALYGEQGSAKSTTSRRLRQVVDPARTVTLEKFLDLYAANRSEATSAELEASQFAGALVEFVRGVGEWEGTAAELLVKVNETVSEFDAGGKHWPKTAKAVSGRIRRHAPALREEDIEVGQRRSNGQKLISLRGTAASGQDGLAF